MAISVLMRWQTSAYVISVCMFSTSQTTSSASLFFWRSEQHLIFSTMRSVTDRKGSVLSKMCCFGRRFGPLLLFLEMEFNSKCSCLPRENIHTNPFRRIGRIIISIAEHAETIILRPIHNTEERAIRKGGLDCLEIIE